MVSVSDALMSVQSLQHPQAHEPAFAHLEVQGRNKVSAKRASICLPQRLRPQALLS
jgi:hypothetical protein